MENKKKTKTTIELLHLWCNKSIDKEYNKGRYKITPTRLFVDNKLVGEFHPTKDILYIEKFEKGGAYGNGYSSFNIMQWTPEPTRVVKVRRLPTFDADYEYKYKVQHVSKELISKLTDKINNLSYLKEVANNNRYTAVHADLSSINEHVPDIEDLALLYGKKVYKAALNKKVRLTSEYQKYTGWGKHDYKLLPKVEVYLSPQEIIDGKLKSYLTEEEIKNIEFKVWRNQHLTVMYKYQQRYIHDLKTSREIYNDEDRRKKAETSYKERREALEKKQQQEKEERLKKSLGEYEFNKNHFRQTGVRHGTLSSFMPILSLNNEHQRVITSWGSSVTVEEARQLLQLYRSKEGYTDSNFKVAGFRGITIKKETYRIPENGVWISKEGKTLTIGCHKITPDEIKEFLEYYKLGW